MLGSISGYSSYSWMSRVQNTSQGFESTQVRMVNTVSKADQLETPVQPVEQASVVTAQASGNPYLLPDRQGTDPAEMAVRMRISYIEDAEQTEVDGGYEELEQVDEEKLEQLEEYRRRIFGDGDTEAESIDGQEKVQAEEEALQEVEEEDSEDKEDVSDKEDDEECQACEKRKYQGSSDNTGVSFKIAGQIDPDTVSATNKMEHATHNGICPECGRTYVSGGTSHTVTVAMKNYQESKNVKEQHSTFMGVA